MKSNIKTQTKIVEIDGQEIPMRISAATPIYFRNIFHKDMFKALNELDNTEQIQDENGNVVAVTFPDGAVETVLEMAYVMACQGNPTLKMPFIEWLEGFRFETLTSGEAFQPVLEMIHGDEETIVEDKKKAEQQTE